MIEKEISVSIPAWCDWEVSKTRMRWLGCRVSIPAWCDWEKRKRIKDKQMCNLFQFQLGAIGSSGAEYIELVEDWFQFQLGAIGSEGGGKGEYGETMFQFQLGAIGSLCFLGWNP